LRVANGRFEPGQDGVVVAETHREVDLRGIRAGRWKLIVDRAGGGRKLFDLEQDPGEQKNLRKTHPDVAERLEALLDAHYAEGSTTARRMDLPADLEQRLRSLGYLK
jgi:arylsulfatase A-like enzyme